MNELALQILVIQCLTQGFAALEITVSVDQRYQPLTMGIPSDPTVYVQRISGENVGYLKRTYAYDETTLAMVRSEEQPKITTFQINATAIQDPNNLTQLTAADYVDYAGYILQSDVGVEFLRENNIQVLRIAKARQTQWKDDMRRYEADPSLDCSFVHTSIITSPVGGSTTVVPNIQQVNN
jgi:hypothetical protein